jgi:hypothetical protein
VRTSLLKSLALATAVVAIAAQSATASPQVEAISGHRVSLSDTAIVETRHGPELRGWARRTPGRPGLILAHLRVEAFSADGASLGITRARWNGALAQRDSSAARFYVLLPEGAARVRVNVERGALR